MLEVPTSNLFFQFFQLFFRLLQDHMILYLTKLLLCFQVTSRRTKKSLKPFHIFTPETNKYSSEKVTLIVYLFSELQDSNKNKRLLNEKYLTKKRESPKMKRAFQKWKQCLIEIILWRYVIPFQVYFFSTFHIWCTLWQLSYSCLLSLHA